MAIEFTAGCWLWRQSVGSHGYGQVHWEGRNQLAHRVVYVLLVGPVPESVHHVCHERRCVRPDHLVATTRSDHNKLHSGPTCSYGHPWSPENTYMRADGTGRQCRACKARVQRERNRRLLAR